jgi:serine/threonine-protein kinase
MINSTISKYKITRLIGEGGMASVYEAEHEMLGTRVAIKILNPILSANTQIKERFRNEAKIMASLDHPNIIKVIDFDEQPQRLSIIIEYLNGEDLNRKIKRDGPLSEKLVHEIFPQMLNALQYAHDKEIIHRDIKPSNIFILPNGHVKILDFGIAKLLSHGNGMTQTGTQLGTPVYMSPEQVKADKSIDHRSDIYSIGVTMFYAINGKPPYNTDTDSQFDIFNKIVYEPLPNLSATSKYNDIILKACQKNRNERFQRCSEIKNELELLRKTKSNYTENTLIDNHNSKDKNHKKNYAEKINIENENLLQINQNSELQVLITSLLLQLSFGLGFFWLGIKRNRKYLYILLIGYSWLSYLNFHLVDSGRGPLGHINILRKISRFQIHYLFYYRGIYISAIIGHALGFIDLLATLTILRKTKD